MYSEKYIMFLFPAIGAVLCEVCCLSIAVSLFEKRHVGKVTGLYLAVVSVGKIYYAATYQLIFLDEEGLGRFFLSIPIGFTLTIFVCIFCHKPAESNYEELDSEDMSLTDCEKPEAKNNSIETESAKAENSHMSQSAIAKSWFFHFFLWPNAFFCGCAATFMNNITAMSFDIGMEQSELIIYILSIAIMVSRLSLGSIYDCFGTKIAGTCLLIFSYVFFAIGMFLGRFWLTGVTIFVITVLGGVGIGAGFALTLTIVVLEFGLEHYAFLLGVLHMEIILSALVLQLITGITHDHRTQTLPSHARCHDCFDWSFVILFCGTLVSILFAIGDIYIFRKRKRV